MKKNTKLLSEAIQAFIEGDTQLAETKIRKHFVESAIEINKNLEEEFQIEEDIHTDPESSFQDEVQYELDEEKEPTEEETTEVEIETDEIPSEESPAEFGGEEGEGNAEEVVVDGDSWEDIMAAIDSLSATFAEINSDSEGEEEVQVDGEGEDEFADVQFGEEKFGESYKMKPVAEPSKTETEATNKKSPVAPNATSPVQGVKPVKTDTSEDSVEPAKVDYKVEDNNNVMNSDKELMSDAKEPTHSAEKSDSVVPKRTKK